MNTHDARLPQGLVIGLVLLGVIARLVPHPWNVTPLTALALFGAALLSRRWAIGLPLTAVILSDAVLGFHEVIAFTWGGFVLTGLIGWWLRKRVSIGRLVIASLLGSTVFFLVTNFGVWLLGEGGTMYPKTVQGVWLCYTAALPFFRNGLFGDLVYTLTIFGLFTMATKAHALHGLVRTR